MSRSNKKWVAILLAIWLPLFSGNAMANSMTWQLKGGHCQMMAAMHQAAATPSSDDSGTANASAEQQDTSCNSDAVCHFGCVGYLATVTLSWNQDQYSSPTYTPISTRFQSITSAPLDPPPRVRV